MCQSHLQHLTSNLQHLTSNIYRGQIFYKRALKFFQLSPRFEGFKYLNSKSNIFFSSFLLKRGFKIFDRPPAGRQRPSRFLATFCRPLGKSSIIICILLSVYKSEISVYKSEDFSIQKWRLVYKSEISVYKSEDFWIFSDIFFIFNDIFFIFFAA